MAEAGAAPRSTNEGPRLAVIPARGGSRRIPRKNVRRFAGKPMLHYAIEAARASGLFDRIVVSTDDPEIVAAAEAAGAEAPFLRPVGLADDHTPTLPVVAHAIEALRGTGFAADEVCCIYPAVPLLAPESLVAALAALRASGAAYAFPVTPFPAPIQRALRRDAEGRVSPFWPEHQLARSQDLEPAYHDAGQFYWGRAETWLAGRGIHAGAATIVLAAWQAVDIDTPEDWARAEALFLAARPDAAR